MSDTFFVDRRVHLSEKTQNERAKLKYGIDDFASFYWAGTDMFESFGAFIINEKKGSLKFYNGASFSNTYTKQQFMDGYTNLSGVSFDTQKITFTIGVYWISIEDYRVLLNLLHPYEVNDLAFSFEPHYGYRCKLGSIKESTRYIVGKESMPITVPDEQKDYSKLIGGAPAATSEYRYYTELSLTFDVIGTACAIALTPFINNAAIQNQKIRLEIEQQSTFSTDLDCPLILNINNVGWTESQETNSITGSLILRGNVPSDEDPTQTIEVDVSQVELFHLDFKNLPIIPRTVSNTNYLMNLTYNSEFGTILMEYGDKSQILTLLTTLTSGSRILKSLRSHQFFIPGRLSFPEIAQLHLIIDIQFSSDINQEANASMIIYPRTNVL